MKQLQDRVAIVTGASSGLGRAVAEMFAAEGAKVVLAARRKAVLDEIAAGIEKQGGTALVVATDVTKEADVIALFEAAKEKFGRVDVLINNAGVPNFKPTEEMSLADWQAVVDLNLTGAFLCSREALRVMKPQGGGRIVSMGSISAWSARTHAIGYN
jgi:NAD(P)-dependent dehydrogenase (short-subunit alcohol dehydrogenase family)